MPEHQHQFRMVSHIDGCHWWATSGRCECGATFAERGERDIRDSPYSAVWMADEGGDDPCVRCAELLAGAEPIHERVVTEAE